MIHTPVPTVHPKEYKMTDDKTINLSDMVRVRDTSATHNTGLVGLTGVIAGWTIPSFSNVEVIGELTEDFAIFVYFEERKREDFWFKPDLLLLDLIDHSPKSATEIWIDGVNKKWIRTPSVSETGGGK
jgi:hypothetical protein